MKPRRVGISMADDVRKIVTDGDRVFFAVNDGRVRSFAANSTLSTQVNLLLTFGK